MNKYFKDYFTDNNIFEVDEINFDDSLIINPHRMPEGIKSAIVFLIPYYTGPHESRNISLYAISKDYHLYAKKLSENFCSMARKLFPEHSFYGFCDTSPINDISAAIKAGLGVLGKNRLLINKTYGSYVFIGSILSTLKAENPKNESLKKCIGCGKCLTACDFISGKSGICFSELNQKKNLTDKELAMVKSKKIRWGCDICSEVCPMNKDIKPTPIEFFYKDNIEKLTPEIIESMTQEEFNKRAYSWRGKKTILRNITE